MYLLFALPPFFLDPPELKRLGIELLVATAVAGLVFVLFPVKLGFDRVARMFRFTGISTRPCSPSISHSISYRRYVALFQRHCSFHCAEDGDYSRGIVLLWTAFIAVSTVLVISTTF